MSSELRDPTVEFDYPPHKYVENYRHAAEFARHKVGLTYFPDRLLPHWISRRAFLTSMIRPYLLCYELWRRRHFDLVIVREFLTVPLVLALPAVWWFRKRTAFVLMHNIQMASDRLRDRLALWVLYKAGFNFICVESDAGLRELRIDPNGGQILVLPHSYIEFGRSLDRPANPRPVLGIVGQHRPEKSIGPLLERLADAVQQDQIDADILVGNDNREILALANRLGFEAIDTTDFEAYLGALDKVDIIILDYNRERYLYRSSGVITDAIFRRKVVICPDYPIFRAQVQVPEKVGVVIESWDRISAAVGEALDLVTGPRDAFDRYIDHRTARSVALYIDDYLDKGAADRSAG